MVPGDQNEDLPSPCRPAAPEPMFLVIEDRLDDLGARRDREPRVFTLRCTRKLLKRLQASPGVDLDPPTTRLGDWYATLVYERTEQLVLCVSERSLLPVVLPAKEARTLVPRFRDALAELLAGLGVPPDEIERERAEMADVRIGRTASRQILGSMNDFLRALSYRPPGRSLLDESRQLAEAPCGPIGMRSPDELTVEMLRHLSQ